MPFVVNYKTTNAYLRQIHDKVKSCNLYKLYETVHPTKSFFCRRLFFFMNVKMKHWLGVNSVNIR